MAIGWRARRWAARFTAVVFGCYQARSGSIAPSHRPRWSRRRLWAAVALLADQPRILLRRRLISPTGRNGAGNSFLRKRHTLSTHCLFVRSRRVHRRSSRPHHDRAFFHGADLGRRGMHGATFVVDAPSSPMHSMARNVIDMAAPHDALKAILGPLELIAISTISLNSRAGTPPANSCPNARSTTGSPRPPGPESSVAPERNSGVRSRCRNRASRRSH